MNDFTKRQPLDGVTPKCSIELDAETGRAHTVYDFRGTQNLPDRPAWLWCDFCSRQTDHLTFYPTRAVGIRAAHGLRNLVQPRSWWGACALCLPLFETQNWNLLAARCFTVGAGQALPHAALMYLHSTVYDSIEGPPEEWHGGESRFSTREGYPRE